ncbi:hypothetical protein [Desulfovibrio sp. ZJ369]|uniref:hypothetical protein n=1 Tax=Desulfovibrio sp. ZJ369 TaxID=2709793 RepID=UPI0013EDBB00|nr:hypothetical protein [Desulfovibrio sp. ZJ369]
MKVVAPWVYRQTHCWWLLEHIAFETLAQAFISAVVIRKAAQPPPADARGGHGFDLPESLATFISKTL